MAVNLNYSVKGTVMSDEAECKKRPEKEGPCKPHHGVWD